MQRYQLRCCVVPNYYCCWLNSHSKLSFWIAVLGLVVETHSVVLVLVAVVRLGLVGAVVGVRAGGRARADLEISVL